MSEFDDEGDFWDGDVERDFQGACAEGDVATLQQLLSLTGCQTLDVHCWDETGLRQACRAGQLEVVQLLLSLGGERQVDVMVSGGQPFLWAAERGHVHTLQALLALPPTRLQVSADLAAQAIAGALRGGAPAAAGLLLTLPPSSLPRVQQLVAETERQLLASVPTAGTPQQALRSLRGKALWAGPARRPPRRHMVLLREGVGGGSEPQGWTPAS